MKYLTGVLVLFLLCKNARLVPLTGSTGAPAAPSTTEAPPPTTAAAPSTTAAAPSTTAAAPSTTAAAPSTTAAAPSTTTVAPTETAATPDPFCVGKRELNPHPKHCNKFIRCIKGFSYHYDCPPGLFFDPKHDYCNWDYAVDCDENGKRPSTVAPSTTVAKETTTAVPGSTRPPTPSIAPIPKSFCIGKPEFNSHSKHCDKFIRCVKGHPFVYNCQPDLFWDPSNNFCNWDYAVDCVNGKRPISTAAPSTTAAKETSTGGTTSATTIATETTPAAPKTTPEAPETTPAASETTPSAPEATPSAPKTTSEAPETTPAAPETTTAAPVPTTQGTTTNAGPTTQSVCAGGKSFVRDANDCSKYFQCFGSTPIMRSCPDGLVFDLIKKVCNWKYAVDCSDDSEEEPTTKRPTTTPSTTQDNAITGGPTDKPTVTHAPATTAVTEQSCKGDDADFSPHPDDCSKYIRCIHGRALVQSCAPPLKFDKKSKSCTWANLAEC